MKKTKRFTILISTFVITIFIFTINSKFQYFDDFKSMISLVTKSMSTKASIDDYKFFENVTINKSNNETK